MKRTTRRAMTLCGIACIGAALAVRCGTQEASTRKDAATTTTTGGDVNVTVQWKAPADTDEVHMYEFYASKSKNSTDVLLVHTESAAAGAEDATIDTKSPSFTLSSKTHDKLKAYTTGTVCISVIAVGHSGERSDKSEPACADN